MKDNTFIVICLLLLIAVTGFFSIRSMEQQKELSNVYTLLAETEISLSNKTDETMELTQNNEQLNNDIQNLTQQLDVAQLKIEGLSDEVYNSDYMVTEQEIDMIARVVGVEAGGLDKFHQSLVIWCILNRVDAGIYGGKTVTEVLIAPLQFHGDNCACPLNPEIRELVVDVIHRWHLEKISGHDVGRTLPREYVYYWGDGEYNHFRIENTDQFYYQWQGKFNPYE